MPSPAISIIIPNYNYGRFIGETLQSVLDQTFTDFEAVVVDDGSKDNSVEVISSYAARDARMRLIQKKNGGLSSARNAAVPLLKGRLVAFLDSDDIWAPDFLSTMVEYFSKNPKVMVAFTNAQLFESDTGRLLGGWFGPNSRRTPYSGRIAAKLFTEGNHIPIVTAVVKREVFDEAGLFDLRFRVGEDWDFWLRVASHFKIYYIDRELCRIRRHSSNSSFLPLNAFNQIRIYRKTLKWNHDMVRWVSPEAMKQAWYRSYYELGRVLTLQGKGRRARLHFKKALFYRCNPFSTHLWLYYPLTFFPSMKPVTLLRGWLVRLRRLSPKAI